MVSLPRLLYKLQNYPYPVPPSWFNQINALLNRFLWDGGAIRVALATCVQSTYCGGIAAADVRSYYWASQLLVINEWWYNSQSDPAYAVERLFLAEYPLLHLLYSTTSLEMLPPACRTVIQIWRRVCRLFGWWGKLTGTTPLWQGTHTISIHLGRVSTVGHYWYIHFRGRYARPSPQNISKIAGRIRPP